MTAAVASRAPLDAETKALEAPQHHQDELRLWLRLLTCANLVDAEVRRRLRDRFDVTLPRFDLMAQLERAPAGMTLGEVSRRMMVSNGNVTGLVERLVASGDIRRAASASDRRVQIIALTPAGRVEFKRMAKAHANWIAELFAALDPAMLEGLLKGLGALKASIHAAADAAADAEESPDD